MRSHLRTPLIVDVDKTPREYVAGLNRAAKKNCKAALKARYEFVQVPYAQHMFQEFMWMWSEQINGHWAFQVDYFTDLNRKGWLDAFYITEGSSVLGILPMERFDSMLYAQPVMYQKDTHPDLAKFAWFKMILQSCTDPELKVIDLGGGFNWTWDQFISARKRDPSFAYKWRFVSKAVKDSPDKQPPLLVQRCQCGWKFLTLDAQVCPKCGDLPCQVYG